MWDQLQRTLLGLFGPVTDLPGRAGTASACGMGKAGVNPAVWLSFDAFVHALGMVGSRTLRIDKRKNQGGGEKGSSALRAAT